MKYLIFAIAILFTGLPHADETIKKYDVSRSWFQPHLSVNKSPALCGAVLKDLTNYFASEVTGSFFDQPSFWVTLHPVVWQQNIYGDFYETDSNGVRIKFVKKEDYWSGAAIRYQQIAIVPAGFEEAPENYRRLFNEDSYFPKDSYKYDSVDLAQKDGKLFLIAKERSLEERYEIFEFRNGDDPTLICEAMLDESNVLEKAESVESVSTLLDTLHQIIGTEGDCGTLHAQSRHVAFMEKAFADSLVRPWSIIAGAASDRFDENLYRWSVGGIWENKLYEQYKLLRPLARSELERFYVKRVGLNKLIAQKLADSNLAAATDSGFSFGSSWDPPYTRTRGDILVGLDVERIKEDLAEERLTPENAKDLLFLSVERPEVVSLLLSEGWNPNMTNGFGKTPLMEAAQYDALESAKLLLSHGASVEASTHGSTDNCAYQLSTTGLTALHYAVRYGSRAMIELLLNNNSPTYFKDSRDYRETFTPYDYLVRFGGETSYDGKISGLSWGQKNKNLNKSDIELLESRLIPPEQSDLLSIAKEQNLRGESAYARGDMLMAYGAFNRALAADPKNVRVLTNLSLVSMKLDRPGEAAKYAKMVMGTDQASVHEKAAAYFNMGLICAKNGLISYDQYYCQDIPVEYLIISYQLEPNKIREKMIFDFFTSDKAYGNYCSTEKLMGEGLSWIYIGGQHSYVLASNGHASMIPEMKFKDGSGEKAVRVDKVESIKLTGRNATLLRLTTNYQLGWQSYVDFGEFICRKGQSIAEPKL